MHTEIEAEFALGRSIGGGINRGQLEDRPAGAGADGTQPSVLLKLSFDLKERADSEHGPGVKVPSVFSLLKTDCGGVE